jgi:hypothetical protein
MRYLLAAEADKIQEFVFRSSRLREVVGASQLLTRFCTEGAGALLCKRGGEPERDMLVNDGGSFRVIFDDPNPEEACWKAKRFGEDLAELYRLAFDAPISVAEPVPVTSNFKEANRAAGVALRRAKSHRVGAAAEPHMPYVAFCASCGVGLADRNVIPRGRSANRPMYLCATCEKKARERDRRPPAILSKLFDAYAEATAWPAGAEPIWSEDADDMGELDLSGRSYVAYLKADGNSMGDLFGRCDEQQIRTFSGGLTQALNASLAASAVKFHAQVPKKAGLVPVLPLILGGDDLFALIPAPYALDFARQFCLAYERKLKSLLQSEPVHLANQQPTVAAAVIICKSKYPYMLAHRRAEELLAGAKRQCKLLTAQTGEHLSAVNFEVILGNRLAGEEEEGTRAIVASLRPYWAVAEEAVLSPEALLFGGDLRTVLRQRRALKDVPHKRLAELRGHLEELADPPPHIDLPNRLPFLQEWAGNLARALKRTEHAKLLDDALKAFGGQEGNAAKGAYWRELRRGGQLALAQGTLDLLETWDFAQDLQYSPAEYEPQEERP